MLSDERKPTRKPIVSRRFIASREFEKCAGSSPYERLDSNIIATLAKMSKERKTKERFKSQ